MPDPKEQSERAGPLDPHTEGDDVVVHNPPDAPIRMSADEADLSGIRMLDEAAKARAHRNPKELK
jgi:hypothetical protein